jgi:GTP-binding protein HflX
MDLLLAAIADQLRSATVHQRLLLGPEDGALRAWLYRHARVEQDCATELGGWEMQISMPQVRWHRLEQGKDSRSRRICAIAAPARTAGSTASLPTATLH